MDGAIWLVGCGNLGRALLDGWLAAGLAPGRVTVINPTPRDLPDGIAQARAPGAGLARPDVVLLAVKPRLLGAVAAELAPHVPGALLVSVLAGVGVDALASAFPGARVARALPNTAARIGMGVTLLAGELAGADRETVQAMAAAWGTAHWVEERAFDAATAVASSSPAWLFRWIDALAAAGVAAGLAPGLAAALAREAVAGAAAYALGAGRPMAVLAREVASPGGMTQAGLDVIDRGDGLAALLLEAVGAATARAAELGRS